MQPTFYDSFGLTVLEAAACGLPVVTTQFAEVSELLSDGREGYVLPDPADDAALAERLRKLSDPAVRRTMGAPPDGSPDNTPSPATASRSPPCIGRSPSGPEHKPPAVYLMNAYTGKRAPPSVYCDIRHTVSFLMAP